MSGKLRSVGYLTGGVCPGCHFSGGGGAEIDRLDIKGNGLTIWHIFVRDYGELKIVHEMCIDLCRCLKRNFFLLTYLVHAYKNVTFIPTNHTIISLFCLF